MNDNLNIHSGEAAASQTGEAPGEPLEVGEVNPALLRDAMISLPGVVSPEMASALQATENNFREMQHEFGMLDATGLAEAIVTTADPEECAADLRKHGKILSFARLDTFVYPKFQLDLVNGCVKPIIKPLIELGEAYGWTSPDIAGWLCDRNGYLPDEGRPVDVIDDGALVLRVAKNEWGVVW